MNTVRGKKKNKQVLQKSRGEELLLFLLRLQLKHLLTTITELVNLEHLHFWIQ